MRLIFEDSERLKFVTTTAPKDGGVFFYDPQCDNPLEPFVEKVIDDMGDFEHLQFLLDRYPHLEIDRMPSTPYEARRVGRQLIRALPAYTGERYIQ